MPIFQYGQKETDYLKKKDKKLGEVIDRIGMIQREVRPDPFEALISSIVGQQISNKAAKTVWERFCSLIGPVNPVNIVKTDIQLIQNCGMSLRKATYIKEIGEAARTGHVDFSILENLTDQQIMENLVRLKGVGTWTVEMLLIFSLCRPDVLSYKDLAICRGMMRLYGHKQLTKAQFEKYRRRYSPYGSVASLYLWAISGEV